MNWWWTDRLVSSQSSQQPSISLLYLLYVLYWSTPKSTNCVHANCVHVVMTMTKRSVISDQRSAMQNQQVRCRISSQKSSAMSSSFQSGRRKRNLEDYIRYEDADEDGYLYYFCRGIDCFAKKKTRVGCPLPVSQWTRHIVCECNGFDKETKIKVATNSSQKNVRSWLAQMKEKEAPAAVSFQDRQSHPPSVLSPLTNGESTTSSNNKRRQTTIDGVGFALN